MRDYVALPHEYYEEMADLTDEEWGRLVRALLKFSMTGEETELTGNERFFYRRVINRELRYQDAFQETSKKLSEAGKKGAAKRWGNGQANEAIGLNSNTKTNSNTKSKTNSLSSGDEKRREERIRKDILELERFMKGEMVK